jgi:hypothetical protein
MSQCAYEKDEDSSAPQFRTKVQHDVFYDHLVKKSVFAHKSIDWNYLEKFPSTHPLMAKFRNIGLLKFTQLICDWNETDLRQFYATMEIDWDGELITWITSTKKIYCYLC